MLQPYIESTAILCDIFFFGYRFQCFHRKQCLKLVTSVYSIEILEK